MLPCISGCRLAPPCPDSARSLLPNLPPRAAECRPRPSHFPNTQCRPDPFMIPLIIAMMGVSMAKSSDFRERRCRSVLSVVAHQGPQDADTPAGQGDDGLDVLETLGAFLE